MTRPLPSPPQTPDAPLPTDRGAALITAMLIVSLMSVVALSLVDTVRFAARLSINLESREQAQLYAIGAEE
ncbi:MAG: PilX N-terminal domain-containing pilus assembly protein, partial [Pseudomonadota bacterium]